VGGKRLALSSRDVWFKYLTLLLIISSLGNLIGISASEQSSSFCRVGDEEGLKTAVYDRPECETIGVEPGEYDLTNEIFPIKGVLEIKRPLHLKSEAREGEDPPTLKGLDGRQIIIIESSDVIVEGLKIIHPEADDTGVIVLIANSSKNVNLKGNTFENGTTGVRIEEDSEVSLEKNEISNVDKGIVAESGSVEAKGNVVKARGRGMELVESRATLRENVIEREIAVNGGDHIGIYLTSASSLDMDGDSIRSFDEGLLAEGGSEVTTMKNVTIEGAETSGIKVSSSTLRLLGGNHIQNNGVGIELINGSGLTVQPSKEGDNTIEGNTYDGIKAVGSTIELSGGKIERNGGHGILFVDLGEARLADVTIRHNGRCGIAIADGSQASVRSKSLLPPEEGFMLSRIVGNELGELCLLKEEEGITPVLPEELPHPLRRPEIRVSTLDAHDPDLKSLQEALRFALPGDEILVGALPQGNVVFNSEVMGRVLAIFERMLEEEKSLPTFELKLQPMGVSENVAELTAKDSSKPVLAIDLSEVPLELKLEMELERFNLKGGSIGLNVVSGPKAEITIKLLGEHLGKITGNDIGLKASRNVGLSVERYKIFENDNFGLCVTGEVIIEGDAGEEVRPRVELKGVAVEANGTSGKAGCLSSEAKGIVTMGAGIAATAGMISLTGASTVSRNGIGILLEGSAQGEISNALIRSNEQQGLFILRGASLRIDYSDISINSRTGILIANGAKAEIINNTIQTNQAYGVAKYVMTCFPGDPNSALMPDTGNVEGHDNRIQTNCKPGTNCKERQDLCPEDDQDLRGLTEPPPS